VEEHAKPGALDASALKAAGVKPGPWFQDLKAGKTVTLEDGREINGADYLAPPTPGKAAAIFGDTAPCTGALALAKGVDVMIHETTLDASMEEKANSRGHSSTRQAAMLAREAGVGKLIVTHISSRYDEAGCQRLLEECRAIFPACELADDFAVFTL
jgi:Metal-dependent hydrolases of the beta-lactamase superfamily III